MAAMRRGLVHVLAWSLATGAAVTLSWWGVHTVMAGTAYDPPRALPIAAAHATPQESKPLVSSTGRPYPSPSSAEDAAKCPAHRPSRSAARSTPAPSSAPPSPAGSTTASGEV